MIYMKILLTLIAILAVVTNVVVIIFFLRNKTWLKRPHNVFILSLCFTDMITGIIMFITPGVVVDEPIQIPTYWFFGTLYCKFLWARWLLFALGAVSVYTCLFLTVERWTAICRPFKYRRRFASKQLIGFVIFIWFIGLTTSCVGGLEAEFIPINSNHTTPSCEINAIARGHLIGLITIISVSAKFVIPSVIIFVLYTLAILEIRKKCKGIQVQSTRQLRLKSVTKMAGTASLVLVLCWLPNQVYM